MQSAKNTEHFMSDDAVTVLTVTASVPENMPESVQNFYKSLADEFMGTAKNRIFPHALKAYSECTDRRKKYRYSPWRAEFSVLACEKNSYRLTVSSCGDILIDEVHTWRGDGIAKRKMIKN